MNKINIYVKHKNEEFRIVSVVHDFVDGSLYLTFVRENEMTSGYSGHLNLLEKVLYVDKSVDKINKIVKVSYHTSGTIKYHNLSNDRIFGEPLYDVSRHFCFIQYLVNEIGLLTKKQAKKDDLVITLPEKRDSQFYNFSFSIGPEQLPNHIPIEFYSGLFYLNLFFSVENRIEKENIMPFYYLSPSNGISLKTPSGNSCIIFHQKINRTKDIIVYEPNENGLYTMIYHEARRSVPKQNSLIEFVNPNYEVQFTSIKQYYAKFYIKDKQNGSCIRETKNLIKSITFDNRL